MSRTRRTALALLLLALASVALLLCRWQVRRLHERRSSNATLLAARALPPLDLGSAAAPPVPGQRLRVRGSFDPKNQLLLRGRVHDAAPGLEVATAFHIAGGDSVLWVLRGFVASPDAATIPEVRLPAPGEVTIEGLALRLPSTADAGQPLIRGHDTTWRRLDRAVLTSRNPQSFPVYLLLAGDSAGPGQLVTVAPPTLDDGPHLSYALQWFGIAIAILAFGVIALGRGGRGSVPPLAAP